MLKPSWSWLIVLGALSIVVVLGVDIFARPEGLSVNLLAGLAGLGAAVLIAMLLLPAFEKHVRRQRWERVRQVTYAAIARRLCRVAAEMSFRVQTADMKRIVAIGYGSRKPSTEALKALRELAPYASSLSALAAAEVHDAIQQHIEHIRDVLVPRIYQSSEDQSVIDSLAEFEASTSEFEWRVETHRRERLTDKQLTDALMDVIEMAATAYESMLGKW